MAVDRLSITVPQDIGAALRSVAQARGETVSNIVTEAIERQLRAIALEDALAEADRRFGPVSEERIAAAAREFDEASRRGQRRRSRKR